MKIRLEINVAAGPVGVFEHDRPALHMGRDPACELALDATYEGVSWRHARIDVTPSGAVVTDLGSTNGTFVNDRRITGPTLVQLGDAIQLGSRGPRLRLTQVQASSPTDTVPDSVAMAEMAAAAANRPANASAGLDGKSRLPGPAQPDSDPRPTLAGALMPLQQRPPQAGLASRCFAAGMERPWLLLLIVLSVIALAAAGVAVFLDSSWFIQ